MQPSPCAVRTGRAWCHLAFVISMVLDVHTFASSTSVSLFLPLFKSHSIANQGHMRSVSKVFFLHVSYTHTGCSAVYAVPCFARGCYLHLLSRNRVNCACREGKKRRKERGGKIIITYTHRIKVKRAVLLSLSVRVCGVAVLDSSRQRNSKYTART